MMQLNANDPKTLPDPVLERILAVGVRRTAPSMCRPERNTDEAAGLLVPYLNALPRTCAPSVSLAVIMECPWIDANVASLTSNFWLLDLLGNKLAKAPCNRPMQYDDTYLLDKVSGKGFIQVLDWWQQSGYIIGHGNPLQEASDHGHLAVLDWWLESGRLGDNFPDFGADAFDLLEPTRKGDMEVLEWWVERALKQEMDLNDMAGETSSLDSSQYLLHTFAEAMWIALTAKRMDLVDWWIDICRHYSGISDTVMSVFFASGDKELVAKYCDEYVEHGGNLAESFPYVAFSGNVEYIEHCRRSLGAYSCKDMNGVPMLLTLYASCAGHVHVLEYLKSKGWLRPYVLTSDPSVLSVCSSFWSIMPRDIFRDGIKVGISTVSPLEILAQQGLLRVLEWWGTCNKADLCAAFQDETVLMRFVNLALANNHVAVLDWLFTMTNRTQLPYVPRGGQVAASRGHLSAIQWFLKMSPGSMVLKLYGQIEEIIRCALVADHFEIVEWLMAAKQSKFDKEVFHTIYEVLLNQPHSAVLHWCLKNAHRLPSQYGKVIRFTLFETSPDGDLDYELPTSQELWSLLCMIGARATAAGGKRVQFVTSILDEEEDFFADEDDLEYEDEEVEDTIKLLRAWKNSPLLLARLRAMGKGEWRALKFPLNLNWASEAAAGVAVLDWMYSSYKASGECKWSAEGHQHLCDNEVKTVLKWWEKMDLPREPEDDADGDLEGSYDSEESDSYFEPDGEDSDDDGELDHGGPCTRGHHSDAAKN